MKTIVMVTCAALLMTAAVADADAAVCANGVWRPGCAGPNGAAVVRKPVAVAPRAVVVTPAPVRCADVNGARVCR